MTQDNKYNGWANYATWRIRLEIFDGDFDLQGYSNDTYQLSNQLKDFVDEIIFMEIPDGLAKDYARAFLSEVNWYEIAEYMIDDEEGEAQSQEDYDETA